jgi:hypothetical protein
MSGDNRFVIEAETEDEAREELLDLLGKLQVGSPHE